MPAEAKGLLKEINLPEDLRQLDRSQVKQVSEELRDFIIDNAAEHGGHFAASLGVVELTTALHYVFNTPYDQIVWDVGHQAYGHKILTGRRDNFHTNRLKGGVAPFPKRAESEYDTFGVGHSSTSISAALGMAMASQVKGEHDRQHIAVIGDGSMTGGMAFEALNNAGVLDSNLLVILNDNNMSIDPNVGALNDYLVNVTASGAYNKIKDDVWDVLGKFNKFGEGAREMASRVEKSFKGIISKQSNLFESLKFRYFGSIDGHDIDHLIHVLEDLKKIDGPKLLHISTVKGKGFSHAELDPLTWHAPNGKFDPASGTIQKKVITEPQAPKYQDVFGHTLVELAESNDKIMGITPAMPSGCSMKFMMDVMPERSFDVGIAEQHAVTFAAGLATQGMVPFCNIYSTFMQRAYDQVVHDVATQNLPVIFCLDRGGIAGADGATHQGAFDIAYMRHIPNMIVSAPMDEPQLRHLMYTAQKVITDGTSKNPWSIRYPRGAGVTVDWKQDFEELTIGTARVLNRGDKLCVITIGTVGNYAQQAIQELKTSDEEAQVGHIDLRFVKPLDTQVLQEAFGHYTHFITVEDGCLMGGMGSAILEFMSEHRFTQPVVRLGIKDEFIEHGGQEELHHDCGYSAAKILEAVQAILSKGE